MYATKKVKNFKTFKVMKNVSTTPTICTMNIPQIL